MSDDAPVCPINHGDYASTARALQDPQQFQPPVKIPVIPPAYDLPSLIRTVNVMREVLRQITTSLTVNNVYPPRAIPQPKPQGETIYAMSPYPDWYQANTDTVQGMVYYKGPNGPDKSQGQAAVERVNAVQFFNINGDEVNSSENFIWRYLKALDSEAVTGKGEPFREDFFERIVSVKWAGAAVFVAGDYTGYAAYSKSGEPKWTEITVLPFVNPPREFGGIYASAYGLVGAIKNQPDSGKSVFLLGGYRFHEMEHGTWNEGIIMASTDGINYEKVYSFVGLPYEEEFIEGPNAPHWTGQMSYSVIHSMVWDGTKFWAGGHSIDRIVREDNYYYAKSDVLLSSSDGLSWSEAGRTKNEGTDPVDTEKLPTRGLMVSHCSSTFIDANGNGVPNGVWGEDKTNNIKIGPAKPPTVDYTGEDERSLSYVMPIGSSSSVRIISEEGDTTADTGVPGVFGVAFAGGTWWAVGSTKDNDTDMAGTGASAYSTDNGKTWKTVENPLSEITTVSGGKSAK